MRPKKNNFVWEFLRVFFLFPREYNVKVVTETDGYKKCLVCIINLGLYPSKESFKSFCLKPRQGAEK